MHFFWIEKHDILWKSVTSSHACTISKRNLVKQNHVNQGHTYCTNVDMIHKQSCILFHIYYIKMEPNVNEIHAFLNNFGMKMTFIFFFLYWFFICDPLWWLVFIHSFSNMSSKVSLKHLILHGPHNSSKEAFISI